MELLTPIHGLLSNTPVARLNLVFFYGRAQLFASEPSTLFRQEDYPLIRLSAPDNEILQTGCLVNVWYDRVNFKGRIKTSIFAVPLWQAGRLFDDKPLQIHNL